MPFYRFSIDTPLTPEKVMARLRLLIHERKRSGLLEAFEDEMLRSKDDVTPFVGKIDGHSFRVRRDRWKPFTGYPRIRGDVLPAQSGSRVRITLLPNAAMSIILLGWAGIGVAGLVSYIVDAHASGGQPIVSLLVALAVFLLFAAMTMFHDAYDIWDTFVTALRANV